MFQSLLKMMIFWEWRKVKCLWCDFDAKNLISFGTHAAMKHNVSGENSYRALYNITETVLCKCGCGLPSRYISLSKGYSSFLRGHVSKEIACKRGKKISEAFLNNPKLHGSKTDPKFGEKISETRKEMHVSGTLISNFCGRVPWCFGKTKETDKKIFAAAKKTSDKMLQKHFSRLDLDDVSLRIRQLNPELTIVSEAYQNKRSNVTVLCSSCGEQSTKTFEAWMLTAKCFICSPKESKAQLEIYDFVHALCPDAILSSRDIIAPFELDIWVPSKSFAIEYNGLYWHSDAFERHDKKRHNLKSEMCTQKKICLFHVFEDEWRDKNEIIKSMIRHRLGLSQKIFARQCETRQLSLCDSRVFFDNSHLESSTGHIASIGLFKDNVLVAAMSLRKPFLRHKNKTLEIARFATRKDIAVVGGLSKLVSAAKQLATQLDYNELMTYLDTRLGAEKTYEKVGFSFSHFSACRFWWTDFRNRVARQKVVASNGKTEKEVALELKVFKIFGCKNAVFTLSLRKENENSKN